MNEAVVMVTALALLSALCVLLGVRLSRVWGVDASRMTPALERGKGRSGVLMLMHDVLGCMAPALVCGEALREMERGAALAALALAACAFGVLRYMTLFVSVRHDAACLADIAAEEIGAPMRRIVHLLTLAAVIPALAAVCDLSVRFALHGQLPDRLALPAAALDACALLGLLHALVPAGLQAGGLRSEDDATALAMGGALIPVLLAALAMVWEDRGLVLPVGHGSWALLGCVPILFTMELLARLGGRALCGLLRRNTLLPQKPKPYALPLACLAVLALGCALAYAGYEAALSAAGVCAALLAAAAWISCAMWFSRIGRSMF